MNITIIILTALIILLMFGAGQKILDNMRLNDTQAIIVLLAIAIGIAIPPIKIGNYFAVSIGGFIIPYVICIYMLISCGWSRDLLRAIIGTIVVAGVIYGLEWLLPSKTAEDIIVDNTFIYGLVAGVVAYALGRSRRNAFICSIFGISTAQILQWGINWAMGAPTVLGLGTGGAFGTYVIATLISVGLAEFLGRAFTTAKPDEGEKAFNYDTHTYDSQKNGKLVLATASETKTNKQLSKDIQGSIKSKQSKIASAAESKENKISTQKIAKTSNITSKNAIKTAKNGKKPKSSSSSKTKHIASCMALLLGLAAFANLAVGAKNFEATSTKISHNKSTTTYADTENASQTYFTVYNYANKDEVILIKGGDVENGDLYLSGDNKLYEICGVDNSSKIAYAKFIHDEKLPQYNVKSTYNPNAEQLSNGTTKENNISAKTTSAQTINLTSGLALNYATNMVAGLKIDPDENGTIQAKPMKMSTQNYPNCENNCNFNNSADCKENYKENCSCGSDMIIETTKKSCSKSSRGKAESAICSKIPVTYAATTKKVGVYHTHNDESYYNPDGTDSVYGEGGIHDVGAALVENFKKLGITVDYNTSLHLPHNSGAYTRSQTTAQSLLDNGAVAIFDIHRDSTPRSEYITTVNGVQMSKVRMVVGSANQNYAENKYFAYSIKSYADEVYPGFIKDIYMGSGNYNQQLSSLAMLFEIGCENIEKDLCIESTKPLSKILDIIVFGSENASEISLKDVDLTTSSGEYNVITGLSNADSGASLSSLWVLLSTLGVVTVVIGACCIFSKTARYKVSRFFSELFAGIFGKKKAKVQTKKS